MDALGIVLFLAFIFGTIFLLMNQARKARETYGFGLIMNWTFLLIVFCLVALLSAGVLLAPTETPISSLDRENALVFKIASVALLGLAGFINVKRSTIAFGIWFTVLQVILAIGIVVPLIMLFSYFRTKNVLPDMMQ